MMVGWRETLAVWPALLAIGGAFAATQFVWSNFVGYELVDIASSVASLGGRGRAAAVLEAAGGVATSPRSATAMRTTRPPPTTRRPT